MRIALALAGGGPEGAVWEIGALRALDEALGEGALNRCDLFVGVSAGAFLAANLANGLSTAQMCRALLKSDPGEHPFVPETFFTPAVGEFVRRGLSLPGHVARAVAGFLTKRRNAALLDSMSTVSRSLPVALFDGEPIRRYLRGIYTLPGRSDDFRELERELYVVAADLDRGEPIVLGGDGWDHVPISRAIQASSALPGLYPPVEIDGRRMVDGVLLKTLHASVALDRGAGLVIAFNPIVPVDVSGAHQRAPEAAPVASAEELDLQRRGLPTVLSQTFRTLIHSRLRTGMRAYADKYPHADVLLFEPDRDDYRMFFTNIFAFSARRDLVDHAYRATRHDLLTRYAELAPVFARRGLELSREVLADPSRDVWRGVGLPQDGRPESGNALARLDGALDRLERLLR